MSESIAPNVNMSALLGAPESNPEPKSALENALADLTPEDAAATSVDEARTSFRTMLDKQQLADLKKSAPVIAPKLVTDLNAIIGFGAPVLTKLNAGIVEVMQAQKDIVVPEADKLVVDLLRNIDGYGSKYGANPKVDGIVAGIKKFFKTTGYNIKTMKRDAEPIVKKMDMIEISCASMEDKLKDNVSLGQQLYKKRNESLVDVVAVLAALEEIIEVAKDEFKVIDGLLVKSQKTGAASEGLQTVEYKGKTISVNELSSLHTDYANGISELERSFFDWRQQFFVGYGQLPTSRNLILTSAVMQRRLQVFRTMGIPQGRNAIVSWQQGVVAQQGAEFGSKLNDATNQLIQGSAKAVGEAVTVTAMAAQAPVVSDESIFAIIDSIRVQCEGIVAADKWGRAQRAKSIGLMEAGERTINTTFTESRRQLVANAVATAQAPIDAAPAEDAEILKKLGVVA